MRYKLTFVAGFAAGYVAGARAGQERYEQIARLVRGLRENPTVQGAAGILQAQATDLAGVARHKARTKVAQTVGGRDVTDQVAPYPEGIPPLH
jgi:hypothetical protein